MSARMKLPGVVQGFGAPGVPPVRQRRPTRAQKLAQPRMKLPGTVQGFGAPGVKKAKKATHAKKAKQTKRGLALDGVACCAAEALAASLRLTGWPVSDRDVLALYEMTAGAPDEGATILATLEAAHEAPVFSRPALRHAAPCPSFRLASPFVQPVHGMSLILGLDLPDGPHAVCDDGTAWWSWGQPYDPASFPDAVIEEVWAVTWS